MALMRLTTCLLLGVLTFTSIQGASFSSDKNSSVPIPLSPDVNGFNAQNLLANLPFLQSAASDNAASVTGSSVTSTSGSPSPAVAVRPAVPPPNYSVPPYAANPVVNPGGPSPLGGFGGPGLGGFGGPGFGGFGGLFPGFGGNIGLDVSGGGYFPIVEKVIVVVGGGILILLLLACIQGSLMYGGLLYKLGKGVFDSFESPLDIQGGVSAATSTSLNSNVDQLNNRVQSSINKQF